MTTSRADWEQSLADGTPGIALLHIERARRGIADWEGVHRLAQAMTRAPVQAHGEIAGLFYGAPAVAYALHSAGQPAYARALATLDSSISALIRLRLDAAHRRMDNGQLATACEYDLISGITGLGGYLMHRHHDHERLRAVLAYLVRLTQPIRTDAGDLPGWWATGGPDRRLSPRWDGGHAGFGMAHGISGPLALLSAAMSRGVIVSGHHDAIRSICSWLDQWRTAQGSQAWWPEVIDRSELQNGLAAQTPPPRPSWCYGTPGIAYAQHIAALAVGDHPRARIAERAMIGCLTDDQQLTRLTDAGLCHGWAGLIHTARRVDGNFGSNELASAIDAAKNRLHHRQRGLATHADDGFLDGRAGQALAEYDPTAPAARPRWDTCLFMG